MRAPPLPPTLVLALLAGLGATSAGAAEPDGGPLAIADAGVEQDAGMAEDGGSGIDAGWPLDAGATGAQAPDAGEVRSEPPPAPPPVPPPPPAPSDWDAGPQAGTGPPAGASAPTPIRFAHGREGSGTSWQPDSTPIHAYHLMVDDWMFMFHGELFGNLEDMTGPRGGTAAFSTNWVMGMARHALGEGSFEARAMLSAEPLTVAPQGYPLLLQTGEAYDGVALHDVQHPHNAFMELAVIYTRALVQGLDLQLYLAPAGEPALGPTAFMHRESASSDPLAPIGHHHQDSTHVSFGVLTLAVFTETVKVEGSVFNGREPDQHRWAIELAPLDSWSARISANPIRDLSLEVSFGELTSPEQLTPEVNQERFIASAVWNHRLESGGFWASTLVWGRVVESVAGQSNPPPSDSLLLESNLELDLDDIAFGRAEWVQRTAEDLSIPTDGPPGPFAVGQVSLGYVREVGPAVGGLRFGIGVMGMLSFVPQSLEPYYLTTVDPGVMVFVRVRPVEMMMHMM